MLALKANTTDIPIVLFYPPADKQFCDWLAALNRENVSLRTRPIPDAYGWNNKPHALLTLLSEGASEVIWIDTDILVTKRIELAFLVLNPKKRVVAEEALLAKMIGALCALACGVSVRTVFPVCTQFLRHAGDTETPLIIGGVEKAAPVAGISVRAATNDVLASTPYV